MISEEFNFLFVWWEMLGRQSRDEDEGAAEAKMPARAPQAP